MTFTRMKTELKIGVVAIVAITMFAALYLMKPESGGGGVPSATKLFCSSDKDCSRYSTIVGDLGMYYCYNNPSNWRAEDEQGVHLTPYPTYCSHIIGVEPYVGACECPQTT